MARSTFPSQNVQNTTCSRPLLAVRMLKKCTPLWREAHFEVKMLKTLGVRTTFGGSDVEKVHAVVARSTFRSQNVQNTRGSDHFLMFRCRFASLHYITLHSTTLHYITLHYTPLHYNYNYTTTSTTLHYTKSAHTALAVKACLLGGNSYTKCSITFVNIAVAISALAGGGQKRFRTETRIRWCFRHFSRIFGCLRGRGY